MIGTLSHILDSGDRLTIILSFLAFLYFVCLFILRCTVKEKKIFPRVWMAMCFIPLLGSLIHIFVFSFGSAFLYVVPFYISIYIPSILTALLPLLARKRLVYIIGAGVSIAVSFVLALSSLYSSKVANYSGKSLSDAYISLCDYLEENYVLSEWKKIDYEKLKKEGLAKIKEAEKEGDKEKYYDAIFTLVESFHDGHAGVDFYGTDYNYIVEKIKSFNDYGICLLTLDDGTTIAVNVEKSLEIESGDVITRWDGVPVEEAIESVRIPIIEGTLQNEKIQKTFYLSGVGDSDVEVTYINSDGEEKTVTLTKIEGNFTRALSTFGAFVSSRNEEYVCKMIDNGIGYLRVTSEETNEIADIFAYITGNHTFAREKFRDDLRVLKRNGMNRLIIDIRNNSGGYEEVATALVSLFAKEKMYAFSLGVKNGGELKAVDDRYVMADGEFSDLDILVLTGMRCGSAGDGLSLYLSRLENVTVAGLSDPSGINQEVGGYVYMPENVVVAFPTGLILDSEGNPNIDIDDTRESRNPVDIKIPLDKEAALKIFDGIDYALDWAVDYLNGNN